MHFCQLVGSETPRKALNVWYFLENPKISAIREISQGKTREKAIANLKEAIPGYLKVLEEDGLPVPEEQFESLLLPG